MLVLNRLQPEEETLKKRLEGLAKIVNDPASQGRFNEIWARMTVVKETARIMEESQGKVDIVWDENQLQIAGRVINIRASSKLMFYADVFRSYCKATLRG